MVDKRLLSQFWLHPSRAAEYCDQAVYLSWGFTDRREILHGGSATSRTGLLFWGDSPRDGRVLGVNRGHMAGSASCWSICPVCIFLSLSSSAVLVIVMYRRAAVDCNIVSVMCFLAALLVHIVMWNVKQDWLFALWAYAAESCQVDDGKLR